MKKSNQMPETEISAFLMDNLGPIKIHSQEFPSLALVYAQELIKTIELILDLGEEEHSGDWDPYLIITLNSGETIETENGYNYMEITEDLKSLQIETSTEFENEEASYITLPLDQIKTIELKR